MEEKLDLVVSNENPKHPPTGEKKSYLNECVLESSAF
jgi:hypothetical protein